MPLNQTRDDRDFPLTNKGQSKEEGQRRQSKVVTGTSGTTSPHPALKSFIQVSSIQRKLSSESPATRHQALSNANTASGSCPSSSIGISREEIQRIKREARANRERQDDQNIQT